MSARLTNGATLNNDSTLHDRRPFPFYSSRPSLEQSYAPCDIITVADSYSVASQDGTVYPVILFKLVITLCNLCFYPIFVIVILLIFSLPYIYSVRLTII